MDSPTTQHNSDQELSASQPIATQKIGTTMHELVMTVTGWARPMMPSTSTRRSLFVLGSYIACLTMITALPVWAATYISPSSLAVTAGSVIDPYAAVLCPHLPGGDHLCRFLCNLQRAPDFLPAVCMHKSLDVMETLYTVKDVSLSFSAENRETIDNTRQSSESVKGIESYTRPVSKAVDDLLILLEDRLDSARGLRMAYIEGLSPIQRCLIHYGGLGVDHSVSTFNSVRNIKSYICPISDAVDDLEILLETEWETAKGSRLKIYQGLPAIQRFFYYMGTREPDLLAASTRDFEFLSETAAVVWELEAVLEDASMGCRAA